MMTTAVKAVVDLQMRDTKEQQQWSFCFSIVLFKWNNNVTLSHIVP